MAVQRLERATLDAVAPQRVQVLGNWLLAFDPPPSAAPRGAVPCATKAWTAGISPSSPNATATRACHPLLRVADLPALQPVHAALPRARPTPRNPPWCRWLNWRMYSVCTRCNRVSFPDPSPDAGQCHTAPGFDPVDGAYRRAALSRSPFRGVCPRASGYQALAAGTASLSQGWASIHGMRTVSMPARAVAAWQRHFGGTDPPRARAGGMSEVFLQVEENNLQEQSLYRRAGFVTAWRYHHWR